MSATTIERRCAWMLCRQPLAITHVCALSDCPAHYCCSYHTQQLEEAARQQGLPFFSQPLFPQPQPNEATQ